MQNRTYSGSIFSSCIALDHACRYENYRKIECREAASKASLVCGTVDDKKLKQTKYRCVKDRTILIAVLVNDAMLSQAMRKVPWPEEAIGDDS